MQGHGVKVVAAGQPWGFIFGSAELLAITRLRLMSLHQTDTVYFTERRVFETLSAAKVAA